MKFNKKITTYLLTVLVIFSCFSNVVSYINPTSTIYTQNVEQNNTSAENFETNPTVSDSTLNNSNLEVNTVVANSAENETCEESNTVVLELNDINDLNKLGITENIVGEYDNINTVTIEIPQGSDAQQIIQKYQANPVVKSAYKDQVAKLLYTPSDPYYSYQWNLSRINMESAWNITKGDSSVVVAVVDTGVTHISDLDGFVKGADTSGSVVYADTYSGQYSYDGNIASYFSDSNKDKAAGHGTAVASLIASTFNSTGIAGIAPNVSIMPVKVFANGADSADSVNIAIGIRWAADNGADIINLSLGQDTGTSIMQNAINYAISKGVMIVAASGNKGSDIVFYPAAYDGVIAVGSSSKTNSVSNFSNKGNELDLLAPGEDILLPNVSQNAYYYFDGTSFSSPTVCAVAALVKSKYPSYSNDLIEQILYAGTDDIGATGWDESSGYGIIDAGKVMSIAGDADLINDNNNTIATANQISESTNYTGNIFPLNDDDYYKFTVPKTTWLKITVTPSGMNDIAFKLYNQSGGVIKNVDENSAGDQEVLTYKLDAGNYYINVFDYNSYIYINDYNINIEPDVTPPEIQYSSLMFDTNTLKVSIPVKDDISGVKSVAVTYVSPVSGDKKTYSLGLNSATNKYEYTNQINEDTERGLWKIYSITAVDNQLNNSVI